MSKWLNGLMGMLWLAAVVLIPLAFNLYSRRVFEPEKAFIFRTVAVLLAVLLIAQSAWSAPAGNRSRTVPSLRQPGVLVAVPLVLLTLWVWLTASVTSIAPRLSVQGSYEWREGAFTFSACVILFVSIVWSGQIERWQDALITAIEITSAVVAGYGILQYFQLDPLPWHRVIEGRAFSTLGHPNFLASYLVLTSALAGSRLLIAVSWRERVFHGLVCGSNLFCMVVTFSRSGWLGLSVAAGCFILFQIGWSPQRRLWLALAGVLVVLLLAAGLLAYADPNGIFSYSALEPFHSFLRGKSATAQVRSLTWQGVWELVQQRPWQGFGPETFRLSFPRAYQPLLTVYGGLVAAGDHAHNEILDLALGTGIVGVGLYAWFLLAAIWVGARSIPLIVHKGRRMLLMGLVAAVAGYTAQNQLSFATIAPLSLFWVMLGLIVAIAQHVMVPTAGVCVNGRPKQGAAGISARCGWSACIVAAGVGAVALIVVVVPHGRALRADVCARQAQNAAVAGEWVESVSAYECALALSPEQDRYWQDLANSFAGLALSEAERRTERFALAEDAFTHAIALSPLDVTYRSGLGTIYYEWGVSGQRDKLDLASDMFRSAVEMSPADPQLWARWGRVCQAQGQSALAIEKYERALQLDPFYVPAYGYLGETYLALQRIADARAMFDEIEVVTAELDRMVSKR